MEAIKKESRQVPLLKIVIVAAVIVVAALIAVMFLQERRAKQKTLAEQATAVDAFSYEGETYTLEAAVKNYTQNLRILRPVSSREGYQFLPGEDALWADATGRFVYVDGKNVKSCDIQGKNAQTVFSVSGSRMTAILRGVLEQYAIVESAQKLGADGYQNTGNYFLIDLTTGDALEMEVSPSRGVSAVCIADGFFYYGTSDLGISGVGAQVSDMYHDICRCDLATGECEVLTDDIGIANGHGIVDRGCVIDGYLYFIYYPYPASVARIPIDGGEVEQWDLDLARYGASGISRIAGYDGKVLLACECREDSGAYAVKVLTLDPSDRELSELFQWSMEESASIVNFRVQDDTLIVCDRDGTVLKGELTA